MFIQHSITPERTPPAQSGESASSELNEPDRQPRFTLRDFLLVLFKYKSVVICCWLATVLGTLGWFWIRSDAYETSAKIVIKFTREAADPQTSLSPSTTRVLPASKPDINTEAELIKSYALVNDLVTTLHLDTQSIELPPSGFLKKAKYQLKRAYHSVQNTLEDAQIRAGLKDPLTAREKAIVQLIRGLKVETVKDSSVVKVTLSSPIKQGAGEVVNTLIELYRKRRMTVQEISGKTEFFDRQAQAYKARVHTAEERLQGLKERFNISSMPEQTRLLLNSLSEADRLCRETSDMVRGAEAKAALLRNQLKQLSPTLMTSQLDSRNIQLDSLSQRKSELELERQKLSAKFDDRSVILQDLDSQIRKIDQLAAQTQATVQQSKTTSVNGTYVELEKELLATTQTLAAARARLEGQQNSVKDYQQRLEYLRAAEISFNQLSREVMLNDETYRLHERNATEAKVSDALNLQGISSIAVVDPAVDPILASGIRKSYLVGAALLVGLLLAIGLAFLFEGLDRSADSVEDVENHLGRPLWGSLPLFSKAKLPARVLASDVEHFSSVASRLERAVNGSAPHVILVRAASAKAGATTVTVGISRALESFGRRTLVIDPDSGPVLHSFQLASGLVARDLELPNGIRAKLWDISSNLSVVTFAAGELSRLQMTSEDVTSLLAPVTSYQFVLIDGGFALSERLRSQLAQRADGVVIVAEWQETRREVLDRIREQARQENVRIFAGILNKRRYHIPQFVYNRL